MPLVRSNEDSSAPSADSAACDEKKYLHFLLDGHSYGLLATNIKQLVSHVQVTKIPNTPKYIRGSITVGNTVVPVVDLKQRFSGKLTTIENRTCIVMLKIQATNSKSEDVGILVDEVKEMIVVQLKDIQPAQQIQGQLKSDFISGMTEVDGDIVTLLDMQTPIV